MKKAALITAGLTLLTVTAMPAMAASTKTATKQCKQMAIKEHVPAGKMNAWIKDCVAKKKTAASAAKQPAEAPKPQAGTAE